MYLYANPDMQVVKQTFFRAEKRKYILAALPVALRVVQIQRSQSNQAITCRHVLFELFSKHHYQNSEVDNKEKNAPSKNKILYNTFRILALPPCCAVLFFSLLCFFPCHSRLNYQ